MKENGSAWPALVARRNAGSAGRINSSTSTHARLSLVVLLPLVGVAGFQPRLARAAEGCDGVAQAWAADCPLLAHQCLRGLLCPPQSAVLSVGCGADALRVEVKVTAHGFRQIGSLGASPIGDFQDWKSEPAGRRGAFEALATCLQRDPSLIGGNPGPPGQAVPALNGGQSPAPAAHPPLPWRMLLGLLLLLGLAGIEVRRGGGWRLPITALGLGVTCWLFRHWTVPTAFFHQNGQGPWWIAFALDPDGTRSPYGPGYWEVFGRLVRSAAKPEGAVFAAQAAMGACVPIFVWTLARLARAPRWWGWGAAILATTNPTMARIAQSESYDALCLFLLCAAVTALCLGATQNGRVLFLAGLAASGLLLSEAARVNPICWLPAALTSLAIIAAADNTTQASGRLLAAVLVTSALLALLDRTALAAVLHGSLGAHWLPVVRERFDHVSTRVPAACGACVVGVLIVMRRWKAALLTALLLCSVLLIELTRVVQAESALVNRAFVVLWVPVLFPLLSRLLPALAGRLGATLGALALVCGVAVNARTWRADTTLPTDALEAAWVETWRGQLPAGAVVIYAGQGPTAIVVLPLYGLGTPVPIESWVMTLGKPAIPSIAHLGPEVYYYESSLCSTIDAAQTCSGMAERFVLDPVVTRQLPEVKTDPGPVYTRRPIQVGLYRVRDRVVQAR